MHGCREHDDLVDVVWQRSEIVVTLSGEGVDDAGWRLVANLGHSDTRWRSRAFGGMAKGIGGLQLHFDSVYDAPGLQGVLCHLIVKTLNRVARVTRRYAITGRFRAAPGPIIERFFGGKDCFFVQVGSNDGIIGPDPLHDLIKANPRWRGIFIEPQEAAFSQLVANYGCRAAFPLSGSQLPILPEKNLSIPCLQTAFGKPAYRPYSTSLRRSTANMC